MINKDFILGLASGPKFTKVQAGWYATEDGRLAVISDGLQSVSHTDRDGLGVSAGVAGGEWLAVIDSRGRLRHDHQAGETLDWFPTKTRAVDFLKNKEVLASHALRKELVTHDIIVAILGEQAGHWYPRAFNQHDLAMYLHGRKMYGPSERYRVWDLDADGHPQECVIVIESESIGYDDWAYVTVRVLRADTKELVMETGYRMDGRA